MAHPTYLCPQSRDFFYAGMLAGIDAFYLVRTCHSSQGAVAARGDRLLPAHFPPTHPLLPPAPAAYRKSGSGLFIGVIWHDSEERNEELRARAIMNLFSGVGNRLVFRQAQEARCWLQVAVWSRCFGIGFVAIV